MAPTNYVDAWWIDLRNLEPYECGATLLTLLAYPEADDEPDRFKDIHQSICKTAITDRGKLHPDYAMSAQRIKPVHLLRSEKEVKRDLRQFRRRLRDRMLAGRMLNVKLAELSGKLAELPNRIKSTSLNNLIALCLDDLETDDAENAKTRIWRESGPVLPLAAAVQAYLSVMRTDEQRPRGLGDLIFDPEAIKFVTVMTVQNERLIEANAVALGMTAQVDKFVLVRLVPENQENRFFLKAIPPTR